MLLETIFHNQKIVAHSENVERKDKILNFVCVVFFIFKIIHAISFLLIRSLLQPFFSWYSNLFMAGFFLKTILKGISLADGICVTTDQCI